MTKRCLSLFFALAVAGCSSAPAPDQGDAGGKGAKQCVGMPTPCSLRAGAATCDLSLGCYVDEKCEGVARDCALLSSTECSSQDGCRKTSTGSCSGYARACSAILTPSICSSQKGCRWEEPCSGSATICSAFSEDTCLTQPGCRLE